MTVMVKMTHQSDPTGSYTTVPKRSFDEYWHPAKGWVLYVESDETEPEGQEEGSEGEEEATNDPSDEGQE